MEPLRCWSMLPSDGERQGLFCEEDAGHDAGCFAIDPRGGSTIWPSMDCAPDHGPAGRLSVAHRLRELSWRADLIDFRLGRRAAWPDLTATIAARLLAGPEAAASDIARLMETATLAESLPCSTRYPAELSEQIAILRAAADLLRPFAKEGP